MPLAARNALFCFPDIYANLTETTTMTTRTARLMLLSGVASAAMMGHASALEAQAFVDRVEEVYRTIGYDFSFGPATLNGDTVTVDGVTVAFTEMDDDHEPIEFNPQIVFSGITEEADGRYFVRSVTIPDIDEDIVAEPPGHITLADIEVSNVYLPAGEIDARAKLQLMGSFTTGALTLSRDGVPALSYDSLDISSTFEPAQGPEMNSLTSSIAISGIEGNFAAFRDDAEEAQAWVQAIDFDNFNGDITEHLTWSMTDGRLNMDEFRFAFDEQGTLDISMEATGVTPETLDEIFAMQARMATNGEQSEEQSQAQMMQGLALLQNVNVVGASIRYDDASLVNKALDYLARQNGADDRDSYVAGLVSTLPALVGQAGVPELTDIVVEPVTAFLQDPQSLEIVVAPPSPTSVLVLAAAAANPAAMITALGLSVQANTPAQ